MYLGAWKIYLQNKDGLQQRFLGKKKIMGHIRDSSDVVSRTSSYVHLCLYIVFMYCMYSAMLYFLLQLPISCAIISLLSTPFPFRGSLVSFVCRLPVISFTEAIRVQETDLKNRACGWEERRCDYCYSALGY